MLILGLTGQSGAGKGIFSKAVSAFDGVYVLDTDITARQVVEKGQPCLDELCSYFGTDILNEDGTLNRRKLASIAFGDKEKHEALNRITHLHIMKKIKAWLDDCKNNKAVCAIIDAPLLFESGSHKLCHVTVGIIAPKEIRLERILNRDGIDEKSGRIRLDSQPDDGYFKEKCDYILENSTDCQAFEKSAKELFSEILSKYTTKGSCK